MADEPDLTDTIQTSAEGPAKVVSDGLEVDSQPIPDLIEADRYLKGEAAMKGGGSGWNCLRPARVVPPAAVGPHATEG